MDKLWNNESHTQLCQNVLSLFTNIQALCPLIVHSQCCWLMSLLFTSGDWLSSCFCSVHPISPYQLNKHFSVQSPKVKSKKTRSNQMISSGFVFTLMLCEGHPLILLHTAANRIVVHTSYGWFEQVDCFPLSQFLRSHKGDRLQCWWVLGGWWATPTNIQLTQITRSTSDSIPLIIIGTSVTF